MGQLLFCQEVFNLPVVGTTPVFTGPEFNAIIGQADKFFAQVRATQATGGSPTLTVKVERSNDGVNWDSVAVTNLIATASITNALTSVQYLFGSDTNPLTNGCFGRLSIAVAGTGTPGGHFQIILSGRSS